MAQERKVLRVGLAGYSKQRFDELLAVSIVSNALRMVENIYFWKVSEFHLVSGLTTLGIPGIGYNLVHERTDRWVKVGVASAKVNDPKYDDIRLELDEPYKFIVQPPAGQEPAWGDESETFIKMIDVLIVVGGGAQSKREAEMARQRGITVLEFALEELPAT